MVELAKENFIVKKFVGRYNSEGRVSGCGSERHGFKSRYLPIIICMWKYFQKTFYFIKKKYKLFEAKLLNLILGKRVDNNTSLLDSDLTILSNLISTNRTFYRTLEFNSLINNIFLDNRSLIKSNFIIKHKKNYIVFELANITENSPLIIIISICDIFFTIQKDKSMFSAFSTKSINLIVELWVYDSNENISLKKNIYSNNINKNYFFDSILTIRNVILFNILHLSTYYKITKIILVRLTFC